MNSANLLAELQDIHLPPPVPIWPLAPGWYVVAVIMIVLSVVLGYRLYRYLQHRRYKKTMLQQLQKLRTGVRTSEQWAKVVAELSILLRRVALAHFDRQEVAGLQGEAWLQFLDKTGATTDFTRGVGRMLISAPYQRNMSQHASAVVVLVEQWVKQYL